MRIAWGFSSHPASPLDGTHGVAPVIGVSRGEGGAFGLHYWCSGPAIGLGGYPTTPSIMAWEPNAKLQAICL